MTFSYPSRKIYIPLNSGHRRRHHSYLQQDRQDRAVAAGAEAVHRGDERPAAPYCRVATHPAGRYHQCQQEEPEVSGPICLYICLYLSLSLSVSISLCPFLSLSHYVSLCPSLSLYVTLCLSQVQFVYISISISLCHCLSLSHSVSLCPSLSLCVSLCFFLPLSLCLFLSLC